MNRSAAHQDDRERVVYDMRWCAEYMGLIEGFPFTDNLAGPEGIHLQIMVPPGTPREACESAIRAGRQQWDVVHASVLECPKEWFEEAIGAVPGQDVPKAASRHEGSGLGLG